MSAADVSAPPEPAPNADPVQRFLRSAQAHQGWLGRPAAVSMRETHLSWVFFADGHVLKRKKPVCRPFLDLSMPAARRAACLEEVRLNERLAPGVYRGVIAVVRCGDGLSLVHGDGVEQPDRAIDWLVWMRRLPAERMLDRLIADDRVAPDDLDALVEVLVGFYRSAAIRPPEPGPYLDRFERELSDSAALLAMPRWRLTGARAVIDRVGEALRDCRPALLERLAQGRVVDGHGDLRPEHVCLVRPPRVIDCLEFSAPLRQLDPFDELAFLALECERAGARWVGLRVIDGCAAALGAPPPALLHLYTAFRAVVRARLALAHLLDARPRTPRRWPRQAADYLRRAAAALDGLAGGDPFSTAPRERTP